MKLKQKPIKLFRAYDAEKSQSRDNDDLRHEFLGWFINSVIRIVNQEKLPERMTNRTPSAFASSVIKSFS